MDYPLDKISAIVAGDHPRIGIGCFNRNYEISQVFRQFLTDQLVAEGYRSDYDFAGCPQGMYWSYSAKVFWPRDKQTYQKQGFCPVPSCTVYISAIAPVAILLYGESVGGKGTYISTRRRGKLARLKGIGWEGDFTLNGSPLPLAKSWVDSLA